MAGVVGAGTLKGTLTVAPAAMGSVSGLGSSTLPRKSPPQPWVALNFTPGIGAPVVLVKVAATSWVDPAAKVLSRPMVSVGTWYLAATMLACTALIAASV